MRRLYLGFTILMTGSGFRFIDEGIFGDIKASSCKATEIGTQNGVFKHVFGHIGICFGLEALSSIIGNETSVSRNVP
jgi:hypothetical protein